MEKSTSNPTPRRGIPLTSNLSITDDCDSINDASDVEYGIAEASLTPTLMIRDVDTGLEFDVNLDSDDSLTEKRRDFFNDLKTAAKTYDHKEQRHAQNLQNTFIDTPQTHLSLPLKMKLQIDEKVKALASKYEIKPNFAQRLYALKDFEIVIICDDSGSMRTTIDNTCHTRWDELRHITKIVLEVGTIFDSNGVDLYFLNRENFLRIKEPAEVDAAFSNPPTGFTPLADTVRTVLQLPATRRGYDKKLLLFIATDGESTDYEGNPNVDEFHAVLTKERNAATTHVMFLACTDDPAVVEYLSKWDREMKNVDMTDDYRTEKEKIRRYRGSDFPFTLGDYVVKALVGAIDDEFDYFNESTLKNN